jgi:hypothetical protein
MTCVRRRSRLAALLLGLTLGAAVKAGSAAGLSVTSQAFTPLRTCVLTATPTSTSAESDATVAQGSPTTSMGTATSLTVQSGSAANDRIYLQFTLTNCAPAIPASATVRLATLRLYVTARPAVCRTLDIFPVTASWVETSITWNNQPFGTTLNNPPTGSRSGTFNVGNAAGCQNMALGYVTGASVTADVQGYVSGSSTNRGWMIRDDTESSATTRTETFASKELGTLAEEPQLVISYVAVP